MASATHLYAFHPPLNAMAPAPCFVLQQPNRAFLRHLQKTLPFSENPRVFGAPLLFEYTASMFMLQAFYRYNFLTL
jgi:hypothetical protein